MPDCANMNQRDPDDRNLGRFPGPDGAKQNSPYQFNPEEIKVLKECSKEAFYQRSLPLGTLIGGALYMGVKNGNLQGHPTYGAIPKVIIGCVVGYFAGKFSYRNKCAEKLMRLPNSPLGDMLRQRKSGGFQENLDSGLGPSMSLPPFSGVGPADTYSDVPPQPRRNSLDMDTSRPEVGGLDDTFRPSLDNQAFEEEEMPPVQNTRQYTYEELRQQNRAEYRQQRIPKSFESQPPPPPPGATQVPPVREPPLVKSQTNKYGDSWS